MKAVLVIDMPQTCEECQLKYLDTGDDAYWGINVERCVLDNCEIEHKERAYDCPLKPMPEKNMWDITKNGHVTEYAEGWNACIDEIMGETE